MTVAEAIKRQKEFIANKYHIFKYSNKQIKESMKVLTKAYDELWTFLKEEHQDILDEFLMKNLENCYTKKGRNNGRRYKKEN